MPYAILRFQKVKAGGVSARYAHNERKKETYKSNPDIDPYRKEDNYHLITPQNTYRRDVQRIIKAAGCKTRSNSTVMVEALITATPEFIKPLDPVEQFEYFERAVQFMKSKLGRQNIISAVVHMDERTPHMHLTFCPIIENGKSKSLSAKDLIGNRVKLSKWQDDFHSHMSERWTELERGTPAQITKRKYIPVHIFKTAERLDSQFFEVVNALRDIKPFNAKSKRDSAMKILEKWIPDAMRFTSRVKEVDSYIKSLEKAKNETEKRIKEAEGRGDERVRSAQANMQKTIDSRDNELLEKDKELLKAQRAAYESADKLRRQSDNFETLIGRLPYEMRKRIQEEHKAITERNNIKKERGRLR